MPLTLEQFWLAVAGRQVANPNERHGQAAFNHLFAVRPDLSEQVRGTPMDPFYRDSNHPGWERFVVFLEKNWETSNT